MLVVNEALQAGLPVIGSTHSQAVSTLIRDGVNGWRYDPTCENALTRSLDCYLGESEQRIAAMRRASRASVAERTPEWAAAGALSALRSVLGQGDAGPARPAAATKVETT
jgi:glycosyltransferase involved in cell wall biosynthesis